MQSTAQAPQHQNNPVAQSAPRSNTLLASLFALFSFLGFLDATYLTIEHYTGGIIPCSIVHGCQVVTTSVYSIVAGVPIALGGSLYYLLILVLTIIYLDGKNIKVLRAASYLSIIGLLASIYLIYVQAIDLHAFCLYCIGSAISSTILFILGMCVLAKNKKLQAI